MGIDFSKLYDAIRARTESYGIRVQEAALDPEQAGKFDGRSVTMNRTYDPEERCYYLVHSLGSIVVWGLAPRESQAVYSELRAAKKHRETDPRRLERAVQGFRHFEEAASQYAVWLLADIGRAEVIRPYTTFARADVEALAQFHFEGVAPVWREFFPRWKREVASGARRVRPYEPKPVPPFKPVPIDTQEVVQEVDGKP